MQLLKKIASLLGGTRPPKVYYLGLAKTGSSTFAALFNENNRIHEFWFEETIMAYYKYQHGQLTEGEFLAFLGQRENHRPSRFDFATFNHFYAKHLVQSSNSLFILPVRDAYSWANSLLNHIYFYFKEVRMAPWHNTLVKVYFGDEHDTTAFASEEAVTARLDQFIPQLCIFWNNAMLNALSVAPKGKTMVLSTSQISNSYEAISKFLHLSLEDINVGCEPQNQARYFVDYMAKRPELFTSSFEAYCQPGMSALKGIGIDSPNNVAAFVL